MDRARAKHGQLGDLLLPVFEEEWRQTEIARRRAEIRHENHRFFLALLMNVPNRTTILQLVKQKFPDQDAVELITDWVRELSMTKIFGSKEPNVLGFPEFGESHLLVFRGLLEGRTTAEIKSQPAAFAARVNSGPYTVEQSLNQIQSEPLLRPIFA